MKKKIIFIVGPTAVGKTRLSIEVAKSINGEIISCDSMQVYRGLDILSCKPSLRERKQIPHHLIDIVSPARNFDVSQFIKLSKNLIEEIHDKGRKPVFVGGTGLYVDSLLNGIFQCPSKDQKIRDNFYRQAGKYGNSYLYQRLKKIDPPAAKKIHKNDLRRIIRALEVHQITGKPISRLQKQKKGILQDRRFDISIIGLTMPRAELYKKIDERVDLMFKKGAVKEIKRLLKNKCSKTLRQALGMKEISLYLKGDISLKEARQLLKRNTHRYAKRQMTWFKRNPAIKWIECASPGKDRNIAINNI
ncbi:MAG: tRNA (adenosine(37)-N6)-dimethylallyltransferase MiaA [Candidatus Omnitrophica bacterium]|nr:tRNA (adenosine(37)-N6)-dimethylallyltransferase MiaA [Candidatus Omnitrophota bacterium]MDD5355228.1 tRNA (adenosine(37)-N6)-dimethylallyltransferase MiaA [Candidatus Omnitrophota bacterium]